MRLLAVAAVLVVVLLAGICGLTRNRLPLWAGLLGVVSLVGAYEVSFAATPTAFATQATAAATTVALTTALGFLVSVVLVPVVTGGPATAGEAEPQLEPAYQGYDRHEEHGEHDEHGRYDEHDGGEAAVPHPRREPDLTPAGPPPVPPGHEPHLPGDPDEDAEPSEEHPVEPSKGQS